MEDRNAVFRSRRNLRPPPGPPRRKTAEGGCGVIGVIATELLEGRFIIRSCEQMQNRGNGKGGGVAAAGLFPDRKDDYALHVALLDGNARAEVEKKYITPCFEVHHAEAQGSIGDHREVGLEIQPPAVWRYFVRVKASVLDSFAAEHGFQNEEAAEDEFVYQNSFRLNKEHYADCDPPRAFVLSHGRDLMILKGVGYAEQIARYYELEDLGAHVWIGHQRYPTRGRVWHPGGAHPFAGLHEALVHNGDFANYHAITEYLRQKGIAPLFVTDTEVSVLLFDHYARVLRYPLEFVIEALGPTPEGDFERLSKRRQRIYRAIQNAHLPGSPDGPWFFILARAEPGTGAPQLIGITDVSMLRPQVFALQVGEKSFGAIASEKQAIDAFFEEVSGRDPSVPAVADRYWNARGGSCTDGGAFSYSVRKGNGRQSLDVQDKFGNPVTLRVRTPGRRRSRDTGRIHLSAADSCKEGSPADSGALSTEIGPDLGGLDHFTYGPHADEEAVRKAVRTFARDLAQGETGDLADKVGKIVARETGAWRTALAALTLLRDRQWDTLGRSRSKVLSAVDAAVCRVLEGLPSEPGPEGGLRVGVSGAWERPVPPPPASQAPAVLALDARGFPPEGDRSASRYLVAAHRAGWRHLIVFGCRGDRFLGCGLGPDTADVRIDVYGSSGDYLGSGMDGAEIFVHGHAQDQVGQILKAGRIVIFGNAGQTFLYGAKGGEAFVMGSAAGRPLINAVGRIRAVINGTCLDYCAESFMAGEQLDGGFVVINGLGFDDYGEVIGLERKYPGNNLFSLASGGACYLNDPYRTVDESQLNGASFVPFRQADWNVLLPYLERNQELFGISIRNDLLVVDGVLKWPKEVFRKIVASVETEKLDWSALPE
jgi:glutamate synthase domain-containing protein 1